MDGWKDVEYTRPMLADSVLSLTFKVSCHWIITCVDLEDFNNPVALLIYPEETTMTRGGGNN